MAAAGAYNPAGEPPGYQPSTAVGPAHTLINGDSRRAVRQARVEWRVENQCAGSLELHKRGEPSVCFLLCTHRWLAAANFGTTLINLVY